MRGLAGIAISFAAGCYSPSAAVGVPCSLTGECPAGQHCNRAVSPPTCAAADARPLDGPPDAPSSCSTSETCDASAPVCDTSTQTCRACWTDTECGDGACVERLGTCVGESNVLWVAATGTNNGQCTKGSPCATLAYAIALAANNQKTIAIGDGIYPDPVPIESSITPNTLTLSGPDRDPPGVVLSGGVIVENATKDIYIEGVTIQSAGGRAVENKGTLTLSRVLLSGAATGLWTTNQNTLRVWDSAITGNTGVGIDIAQTTVELLRTTVLDNGGGGIDINNAATTIESSIIAKNGGLLAAFGGVRYQNLSGRPQVFRFNTVASNPTSFGASGVVCPASEVALESSIFVAGGPGSVITPTCSATYSLFAETAPDGTGNLSGDPAFVSATDFHIGATSAARDAADPAATATRDIDNEVRPQGGGRDIGADEIP